MRLLPDHRLLAALIVVVLALAACGGAVPSSPTPAASASLSAAEQAAARDAYAGAMCPIFETLLALDPRLAAMREAGAGGGDMSAHGAEIDAIGDELLTALDALEAVPDWAPGSSLRFQLISTLHAMRAELLRAGNDPAADGAAEALAAIPFIATDALDRAMRDARDGGLPC